MLQLISLKDTPHSVGLLWMRDRPVAETPTWQWPTLTTDRHPCFWWNSNPQSQQASGHRPTIDRQSTGIGILHFMGSISWRNIRWSCLYSIPHVISGATDG